MLNKLRNRAQDEKGFTLIELLVVILIIGILAAIAIPSFLNQKTKANDANAKAYARTAQTAAETYYTDNQTYPTTTTALTTIEATLGNANNLLVSPNSSTSSYAVAAQSTAAAGVWYVVMRLANGSVARVCGTTPAVTATVLQTAVTNNAAPAFTAGASTGGCNSTNTW